MDGVQDVSKRELDAGIGGRELQAKLIRLRMGSTRETENRNRQNPNPTELVPLRVSPQHFAEDDHAASYASKSMLVPCCETQRSDRQE